MSIIPVCDHCHTECGGHCVNASCRFKISFQHNQRLGEAHFHCVKIGVHVYFPDAIIWVCELTGDFLVAEYGENIPRLTIPKDMAIKKTSDVQYALS